MMVRCRSIHLPANHQILMSVDLTNWTPCALPERKVFDGQYVRLEPLDPVSHTKGLYDASNVSDAETRFRYLYEYPPEDERSFAVWVKKVSLSEDPLYFAVIDKSTGDVAGRQTLMRIDAANGCIEIGHIYWGPLVSRKPAATEALYLFASYVFNSLGYRRFEWKCNNSNEPSKRAAVRFGFKQEGTFRQHLIAKGENRDTAWFSMLDSEWPDLELAYQQWLSPENFDSKGEQVHSLSAFTEKCRVNE